MDEKELKKQDFENVVITKEEIHFSIDSQLFLETLLMEIRGKTISFSVYKNKLRNELETKLCDEIKLLEDENI